MARLQTSKARTDIYRRGLRTPDKSLKQGYSLDRSKPADKDDTILIPKGATYYWWQFKNSPKQFSLTKPKRSQLTQSSYLSQVYDIQDRINDIRSEVNDPTELEGVVDEIKSDIENLKDETQGSLDNMPEQLQSSPTGELLQERIDALESAYDELDGIGIDYEEPDEDEIREELKYQVEYDETEEDEENDDFDLDEKKKELVTDEMIEEYKEEKGSEWLDEKCEEITNISVEG